MSKAESFELEEQFLPHGTSPPSASPTLATEDEDRIPPYVLSHKGHTVHIGSTDWRRSRLLKAQIGLSFLMFVVTGIADQTVGTLMPHLVEHFDTTETEVSVVFVLQFLGYAASALCNDYLHVKFGRLGALMFGTACLFVPFSVITLTNNLPLFIVVYFGYGLGIGLQDASCNVFLGSVSDSNELMGLMHGFYGMGAVISPPMVSLILKHWGYRTHYAILTALSGISVALVFFVFRHDDKWKYDYECTKEHGEDTEVVNIFTLFKNKLVLCFCAYLFFYIGCEISVASWLLTYLRKIKDMQQLEASYVVSWFWVGVTCGRMLLGFVTKRFKNEYRANLWYTIISWITFCTFMTFSLFYSGDHYVWIAKVLVFVMGIFIGPLFPTAAVALLTLLPVHMHVTGSGLVNSLGGMGSAMLPFLVGAISRWIGFKYVLVTIQFILAADVITWLMVPKAAGSIDYDF